MVSRVSTVAFQGVEAVPVDVQVMIAPGKMNIHIVGLPDKAVAESRERVQAALHASGLSMPSKKVTVNLAPADLPKEGSHLLVTGRAVQRGWRDDRTSTHSMLTMNDDEGPYPRRVKVAFLSGALGMTLFFLVLNLLGWM